MANATDVGISLEKGYPPGAAFGNDPTSKFAHVSKASGILALEDFAAWCNRKETEWLAQITSVGRTPLLEGNEGKVAGPQAPAPVLDPDTAEIDPTALRSAMQQLIEILPALPADA